MDQSTPRSSVQLCKALRRSPEVDPALRWGRTQGSWEGRAIRVVCLQMSTDQETPADDRCRSWSPETLESHLGSVESAPWGTPIVLIALADGYSSTGPS